MVGMRVKQDGPAVRRLSVDGWRRLTVRRSLRVAAVGALALALIVAGCGSDDSEEEQAGSTYTPAAAGSGAPVPTSTVPPANVRVVNIDAREYSFTAPETIEGGWVTIRLKNVGREAHHAQFMRLNDGVTLDRFFAALQQAPETAFTLITAEGGPAVLAPDGSGEVTAELKPGQYVIACFVGGPDGVPHIAKGMIKPVEVMASAVTAAPAVDVRATVTLKDFSFEMPATLPAGRATYRVVNDGPQTHEVTFARIAPGKTLADVMPFLTPDAPGPAPLTEIGGVQGINKGASQLVTLDLTPGEYLAICFIPDEASGHPHFALGMIRGFSVK